MFLGSKRIDAFCNPVRRPTSIVVVSRLELEVARALREGELVAWPPHPPHRDDRAGSKRQRCASSDESYHRSRGWAALTFSELPAPTWSHDGDPAGGSICAGDPIELAQCSGRPGAFGQRGTLERRIHLSLVVARDVRRG